MAAIDQIRPFKQSKTSTAPMGELEVQPACARVQGASKLPFMHIPTAVLATIFHLLTVHEHISLSRANHGLLQIGRLPEASPYHVELCAYPSSWLERHTRLRPKSAYLLLSSEVSPPKEKEGVRALTPPISLSGTPSGVPLRKSRLRQLLVEFSGLRHAQHLTLEGELDGELMTLRSFCLESLVLKCTPFMDLLRVGVLHTDVEYLPRTLSKLVLLDFPLAFLTAFSNIASQMKALRTLIILPFTYGIPSCRNGEGNPRMCSLLNGLGAMRSLTHLCVPFATGCMNMQELDRLASALPELRRFEYLGLSFSPLAPGSCSPTSSTCAASDDASSSDTSTSSSGNCTINVPMFLWRNVEFCSLYPDVRDDGAGMMLVAQQIKRRFPALRHLQIFDEYSATISVPESIARSRLVNQLLIALHNLGTEQQTTLSTLTLAPNVVKGSGRPWLTTIPSFVRTLNLYGFGSGVEETSNGVTKSLQANDLEVKESSAFVTTLNLATPRPLLEKGALRGLRKGVALEQGQSTPTRERCNQQAWFPTAATSILLRSFPFLTALSLLARQECFAFTQADVPRLTSLSLRLEPDHLQDSFRLLSPPAMSFHLLSSPVMALVRELHLLSLLEITYPPQTAALSEPKWRNLGEAYRRLMKERDGRFEFLTF